MLENTANHTTTSALMDFSFLDGTPSFIDGEESSENQNSFSALTVATSATSATCSEVFTIVDDFIFSTATCSATSATSAPQAVPEAISPNTISFVDYVLQDCPDGPVMNQTDEELAESVRGAELFAKLGPNATPEQIQGLANLMSDAKLLKIEPVAPRLHSGMLMTNQKTGKPLRCMDCGHRRRASGSAWWIGECDVCGERKGNKACCSVVVA